MESSFVIVSGGSRGLGAHFVAHLLERGCRIATFARGTTEKVQQFNRQHPGAFRFLETDAQDVAALSTFIGERVEEWGEIRGLVNNAAIGQDHLLVHTHPDIIRKIIAVNIEAPILLTRIVLKHMLLQDAGGRIVNISSICGTRGFTGLTAYSASKGALDAFTRSLAHEVGARGILVNSIAPGFFESEMSAVLSADQLATIKRRTPTHRMTTPENILPLLDLLLFGDTNITGQTLTTDGGAAS